MMAQRRALSRLVFGSSGGQGRLFWRERCRVRPAPVVPKKPVLREAHGVEWNDPYHWMSTPAGKAQLVENFHGENRYADAVMADTLPLQRRMVQELQGRMSTELATPPERSETWWYYSKVSEGREFPVYFRRRAEGAIDETLLDQNDNARQFDA